MSTGTPVDTTGSDVLPGDVEDGTVIDVEQLEEYTHRLASRVAQALAPTAAAAGIELAAGPADAQDGPDDLLPPGQVNGLIARLREAPALQVVLLFGEAVTGPASGSADDGEPEVWMAPVAAAMEGWAAELGGNLVNAMPVTDADQLGHLLVHATGTTLMASGLFAGTALAGAVAVVGRTEQIEQRSPLGAGPSPADQVVATVPAQDVPGQVPTGAAAVTGGVQAPAPAAEEAPPRRAQSAALDAMHVLAEVEMKVTAELGRTRMSVSELLALTPGSLIELDRTAGSPIDLLVNGTLIARGEVVVVDEEYGIRLTEITGSDS